MDLRLAAVLIVGGAVCIKMAGGYDLDLHGWQDMDHAWITTVEEGLEMSGLFRSSTPSWSTSVLTTGKCECAYTAPSGTANRRA